MYISQKNEWLHEWLDKDTIASDSDMEGFMGLVPCLFYSSCFSLAGEEWALKANIKEFKS